MNKIKSILKISFVFLTIIFLASVTNRDTKNKLINYVDPSLGQVDMVSFVGANVPLAEFKLVQPILTRGGIGHHLIITQTVLSKAFVT